MSSTHARYAPSSMHRTVQCPGSVALIEATPPIPQDTAAADEGTLAHEVVADLLRGAHTIPLSRPLGLVTDEMLDGAKLVKSVTDAWPAALRVEEHVQIPQVNPRCAGTPDVFSVDADTVRVLDYKFGRTPVSPERNWQLLAYAAGVRGHYVPTHAARAVELTIVQPRDYAHPVKAWRTNTQALAGYVQTMREACADDTTLRAGPACKYCPARHACPELSKQAKQPPRPVNLTPAIGEAAQELVELHDARELLEARISGIEAQLRHALETGQPVPHWRLQQADGRKEWTADHAEVVALAEMFGVNVEKPGLITPTQASKAGLPAEAVATLSARKAGAVKLVRAADLSQAGFGPSVDTDNN